MPLFQLSVKHHRSAEDARGRLGVAIDEARARFGPVIQKVEWSDDKSTVTASGGGFVVTMRVDDQDVHVSADSPLLGALLGKPLESGLRQIVQKTFGKPST